MNRDHANEMKNTKVNAKKAAEFLADHIVKAGKEVLDKELLLLKDVNEDLRYENKEQAA